MKMASLAEVSVQTGSGIIVRNALLTKRRRGVSMALLFHGLRFAFALARSRHEFQLQRPVSFGLC